MNDYLVRATALDGNIRLFAARTTAVAEELRLRHRLFPTAAAALGRTVTAAAMMGAMLKGSEKVTVQVKGNGPLGQIVADADAAGHVRGYVDHPQTHLPANALGKLDVAGAVGREGFIYVVKDLGLREPYRGSVPIVSGELAEDFTYYFAKSEQIPSAVSLGVLVGTDGSVLHSGGFIMQVLPGVQEAELAELEARLSRMPPVTSMLERGLTPEHMIGELAEFASTATREPIRFRCLCSRERVRTMLVSLGREELDDILRNEGRSEVSCHFCNETYVFDRAELTELRGRMDV